MLKSNWNVLAGPAVAHAFQLHTVFNINGRAVRYVAPENIRDDGRVNVAALDSAGSPTFVGRDHARPRTGSLLRKDEGRPRCNPG